MKKAKVNGIMYICPEGVKRDSMNISNTYRLGKYTDTNKGRLRPLGVIFEEKNSTYKLLKNISNHKASKKI